MPVIILYHWKLLKYQLQCRWWKKANLHVQAEVDLPHLLKELLLQKEKADQLLLSQTYLLEQIAMTIFWVSLKKKGDVESLIARDSHLLNVRNVTCDYALQKHSIVFENFTSHDWMILPIHTSAIYTVLFRSYIERILFFDFMMPIFLRWHNNPFKPSNSYDGSLFMDLFMLCYVIFYCSQLILFQWIQ